MLCLPVHKVYTLLPERKVLLAPPNGALATRAHEEGVLKFAWNRNHSDVVQKSKTGLPFCSTPRGAHPARPAARGSPSPSTPRAGPPRPAPHVGAPPAPPAAGGPRPPSTPRVGPLLSTDHIWPSPAQLASRAPCPARRAARVHPISSTQRGGPPRPPRRAWPPSAPHAGRRA